MKPKVLILVIVIVLLVGIGFWFWQKKYAAPGADTTGTPAVPVTEEAAGSIGAVIFEKTQGTLREEFPETNPLKSVIKNPF